MCLKVMPSFKSLLKNLSTMIYKNTMPSINGDIYQAQEDASFF